MKQNEMLSCYTRDLPERFANSYCVSNLYIVKNNITSRVSYGIDPESQSTERMYLDFYVWTPIILLIQVYIMEEVTHSYSNYV